MLINPNRDPAAIHGTANTDGSGLTGVDNSDFYTALATYNLVAAFAAGLTPHADVKVATTAALPAGSYNNGSSGVGATFTVTATGTLTVDGHVVALNERILVKNQVAGLQNGIYLCSTAGATGVSAVLTRATDSDAGSELLNAIYAVTAGTTNGNTQWYVSNASAPTVGTDAVTFSQLTSPGSGGGPPGNQVAAPLSKSGNTIGLGAIDSLTGKTTPANADEMVLADSGASFVAKKLTFTNLLAFIKAYTDTLYAAVGLETLDADYATTAALAAGTYLNGVAGVGATFTATATGTVTVDGHVLALGDRLLVKDQASTLQNGLYTVTLAGALGVALILTRSVDMDQIAEFNGALVIVINGTANGGTFWKQTATVATIGTDPVTFSQFAFNLPANTVTNAMLAQAAAKTLKGNATAGTANVTDLTAPVVSGEMTAQDFAATGLTGATGASRHVGGTASGAPASGTFAVGDFVIDQTGVVYICTVAGTPGTWVGAGAAPGTHRWWVADGSAEAFTQFTDTVKAWITDIEDTDNFHFTSASNLSGTLSKTSGSPTISGTGTLFLSELSVNQVIDIPGGGATDTCVITAIANDTSLTVSTQTQPTHTASGQTGVRNRKAIAIPAGLGGTYLINAALDFGYIANGIRTFHFRINNVDVTGGFGATQQAPTSASWNAFMTSSMYVNVVAGDYIYVVGQQSSTTATILVSGAFQGIKQA